MSHTEMHGILTRLAKLFAHVPYWNKDMIQSELDKSCHVSRSVLEVS